MRILHIITSLRIGGAEVALYNRLKAMRHDDDMQHLVICFYPGQMVTAIQLLGIEVVQIGGLIRGYDPVGFLQVYQQARYFKPSIIHTSLWAANMVGRVLSMLLRVPVINELHGNVDHEGVVRNVIERWSCRRAAKIIAVSRSVRVSYEQKIMPALSDHSRQAIAASLVTVPNGIDRQDLLKRVVEQPVSRAELGLVDSDFVIGAIGRLEKIKSFDVLLRSVAVVAAKDDVSQKKKSIKVVLIGNGSERSYLEKLTRELGLETQVMFMGYRTDAYRFYPLFDCFALSSQSEGLSIALLEAVALGIPVISTHLDAEHDAIVSGKNGILIPPNDVATYADELCSLRENLIVKSRDMMPLLGNFPFSLEAGITVYRYMYQQFGQ